ncbi:protein serine/threonine phosphatase 2C [Penicillium capsulatum]|uniref:Protein serine/threonine phosphatase 2C n=1 Tax=Penicillium capsulatum TaxID=69766 RepID=A0A9W9LHL7_9EURO|nr:protein serine/threonine phosphatase 2C [Penicillium capsulatum]KAJ6106676.1 protein serine/threonine phosphatase 2C [Penicillium capsulatum]
MLPELRAEMLRIRNRSPFTRPLSIRGLAPAVPDGVAGKSGLGGSGMHQWIDLDEAGHRGISQENISPVKSASEQEEQAGITFVRHSLSQVKPPSNEESSSEELVQRAIIDGFVNLDDFIVKTALDTSRSEAPLQEKVKKIAPAYAGSCALLSLYDSITSTLHVACTGDSRAVLGQKKPDGKWQAIPLSVDQTGKNTEEIARLHKEHPGEEDMIKNGRVRGTVVSRAFGDCQWKWPLEFQQDIQRRFLRTATSDAKVRHSNTTVSDG